MDISRRDTLALGAGAVALTVLPLHASAAGAEDLINTFTGGADVADGGVDLDAPEIAENGNTVPISVSAEGASAILLLAAGNPTPGCGRVQVRAAGRIVVGVDAHPPCRNAGRDRDCQAG